MVIKGKWQGEGKMDKGDQLETSLVVQWSRICLPMQGTRVQSLAWEDPTCRGATKPMHHNYWACALEPVSHSYWARARTTTETCTPQSPCATTTEPACRQLLKSTHPSACVPQLLSPCAATTEAHAPRTHALQQEKPPQWDARAPQQRVAPTHHNQRESPRAATKTQCRQKKKGDQLYGDRWKVNFWWWTHCRIYRIRNIMLYTWNLYNVINQYYLNKNFF